jgi:hypothetical protein
MSASAGITLVIAITPTYRGFRRPPRLQSEAVFFIYRRILMIASEFWMVFEEICSKYRFMMASSIRVVMAVGRAALRIAVSCSRDLRRHPPGGTGMGGTGLTIAARSNHGDVPHGVSASLVAARQFSFLAKRLGLPASS